MFFSGYAFAGGKYTLDPTVPHSVNSTNVSVSGGVFDELYITQDADAEYTSDITVAWDFNTILHALFNGSLSAGNVQFYSSQIGSVRVKRREKGDIAWVTIYEHLTDPSSSDPSELKFDYYDHIARGGTPYEYAIVPVFSGVEGDIFTTEVNSDFPGLFIVGADSYFFSDMDMEVSSQRNRPVSIVATINRKYPYVIHNGVNNYDSGNVSALFAEFDQASCSFDVDNGYRYRERLKDFLLDGRAKVLKLWDGRIWLIDVSGASIADSEDGHYLKVHSAFEWTEIGSANSEDDLYVNGLSNYNGGG